MSDNSLTRNANVELWRCFCMLAIVLFHVLTGNGLTDQALWRWHVPGFLIITGYFGTDFSWWKVMRLLGVVYACYFLTIPLRGCHESWLSLMLPHGGWFVPFYVVLLVCVPFYNAILKEKSRHLYFAGAVVFLLAFAWIPCFSENAHVKSLLGAGLTTGGLLLGMSVYILSRLLREYDIAARFNRFIWLLGFCVGIACMWIVGKDYPRAVSYGTPLTLATAICGFCFFLQLGRLPTQVERIILFIAPSMFSVYLIHECCLLSWQQVQGGGALTVLARAMFLFVLSLGIDLVRRGGLSMIRRLLKGYGCDR